MVHPNPEQDEKTQLVIKRHSQVSTASRSTALGSKCWVKLVPVIRGNHWFKKQVQPQLSETQCVDEWVYAQLAFNRWV